MNIVVEDKYWERQKFFYGVEKIIDNGDSFQLYFGDGKYSRNYDKRKFDYYEY